MKRVKCFGLVAIATITLSTMAIAGCAQQEPADSAADSAPSSVAASPESTSATAPAETPASAPATTASTSLSGQFEAGEKPTSGGVQLVTANGATTLEFDDTFTTSESGPDLVVILHRSADVLEGTEPPAYALQEGDYVVLAPLQAFRGAQSYSIPAEINLSDYASVGIWCRRFNATFGVATLQ